MEPLAGEGANHLLPILINGGGFAIIAALFIWLIRTEIPRRELAAATERQKQGEVYAAMFEKLADDFRDEMRLERESHKEEMEAIMIGFDKVVARLDTRLAVEDIKRNRGGTAGG